ncbi:MULTISPECIES: DUF4214 domain-containing protein [Pseudomonas]|uniref:DUF4214 domain-containing protein n=1 Tax=Pseudomonas wuhanensis TaxID=2954098 RepID=A0ABY9GLC4_9PSED|nr:MULTISPECIES: DUF4214 domain-containing protein [unclassified Pseudomonas]WLI10742.1 DUF4214 domain-containing protein [Pseudomonas sp. FP603]WLI16561.1 DUF4214 domain-containing protein [Pseudomonas sp. FP607]
MATTSAQVQQLYVVSLGHAADKAGLDYWMSELNAESPTLTLENLGTKFINERPEYSDNYGGLSRSDTIITLYNNLFNRSPDTTDLDYWASGAGTAVPTDQLLTTFVNGATTADAQVIANKVVVAQAYTIAAGSNYTLADSTTVLDGVDGTTVSVDDALDKLENGSLSGIAIPAGVAALKAQANAELALVAFEASAVTELSALNKEAFALNDKLETPAELETLGIPSEDGVLAYEDVDQSITNATLLRDAVSGSTTEELQAGASTGLLELAADRKAYTIEAGTVGHVGLVIDYENAVNANNALIAAAPKAVNIAIAKVQTDFTVAEGSTGLELVHANEAAGTFIDSATTLYQSLTNPKATIAQISAITDAFDTFLGVDGAADFSKMKVLAATDYAKKVAQGAEEAAATAITGTAGDAYKTAFADKIDLDTNLANALAADALVTQAQLLDGTHLSLEAATEVTLPSFVKDLADKSTNTTDLYYSAAEAGVERSTYYIANFNKDDAIYVGEGYTLNTNNAVDGTGHFTGSDANSLEVFFTQVSYDSKVVTVVMEKNAVGNAVGGATSNTIEIELSGIESLTDVSFSNGVIFSSPVFA